MRKVLAVLIFSLSLNAFGYDGWSGDHKVQSIRVYSQNMVLITMPGTENPGGCESTVYLVLQNPDSEQGKRKYSALLTAYTTGKSVRLALTGCDSGWPIIDQVWLR